MKIREKYSCGQEIESPVFKEFDGSDSGAQPDEAVSWGKVCCITLFCVNILALFHIFQVKPAAQAVKVCADATLVFPLLVAETFAKRVHKRR